MIQFKEIKMRNFFSVGNKQVSFKYDTPITIVTGKNGCGKTILFPDSIYFALYGKAFRKVNLPNMINSLNGKNLEVELSFSIGPNDYLIKRGLRPNYFEIYINGVLKPLPPNLKEYQVFLTKNILKMDERTFKQLVIIGSSDYTPFMRLSLGERRRVIEDLLRIDIFSQMSITAKTLLNGLDNEVSRLESDKQSTEKELEVRKSTSSDLKDSIKRNIEELDNTIKQTFSSITEYEKQKEDLMSILDTKMIKSLQQEIKDLSQKISSLQQLKAKKIANFESTEYLLNFFKNNEICPTCTQTISEDTKQEKLTELDSKIEKHLQDLKLFDNKLSELSELSERNMSSLKDFRTQYSAIESINKSIDQSKVLIQSYKESKVKLKNELVRAMDNVSNNLQELQDNILVLESECTVLKNKVSAARLVLGLLKDDGVKSIIIKNYIPVINNLIRKYLDVIGFNIGFEFDEQFSETIKSRNRDTFEYENFSQGEKLRIDHAILFAFRELSKHRSSICTNLLILDEADGGVLDDSGFQAIKDILSTATDENMIIITHSPDKIQDIATRLVNVKKVNNFTELHEE